MSQLPFLLPITPQSTLLCNQSQPLSPTFTCECLTKTCSQATPAVLPVSCPCCFLPSLHLLIPAFAASTGGGLKQHMPQLALALAPWPGVFGTSQTHTGHSHSVLFLRSRWQVFPLQNRHLPLSEVVGCWNNSFSASLFSSLDKQFTGSWGALLLLLCRVKCLLHKVFGFQPTYIFN